MAIKDALAKFSQFSLKSKVGLGVMAVLCGVLSWSVASSYFAGDDDGGTRRRPPAKNGSLTAKKSGSNKTDKGAAKGDGSDESSGSPVTSLEGSDLFDRLNNSGKEGSTYGQPPPQSYYGNQENSAGGDDRYAGYGTGGEGTEANGAGTVTQGATQTGNAAGSGNYLDRYGDYRNGNSGTEQQTAGSSDAILNSENSNDSVVHDPFASSRAGFGSSGGSTTAPTNSNAENSADRYGASTIGQNTATPGYPTTPGYAAGRELPQLDRSTPPLDRNASTASVATNQLTNNNQAFRSRGNQDWGNSPGAQSTDTGDGIFKGGQPLPPNFNPSYPGAAESLANTVPAGGNRRMETIDSTPKAMPATIAAENQANTAGSAHDYDPFDASRNTQGFERPATPIDQAVREFTAGAEDSFWTISKQAYGDGGYFAALHAFNSQMVAKIEDLRVGDVVRAPSTVLLRERFPTLCPEEKNATEGANPPIGAPGNNARPNQRTDATQGDKVNFALARDSDQDSQVQRASGANNRTPPQTDGKVYVTKDGDDLFAIARDRLGSAARWAELYELNKNTLGENVDELAAGIELLLPR